MKIAIIGSRTYTNKTQIKNFMFRLKMEHPNVEVVSGGAKDGADKYAKKFALEFKIPYSEFPPQHQPHNMHCVMEAYNYGKPYNVGYYHKRNKDLVKRLTALARDVDIDGSEDEKNRKLAPLDKTIILLPEIDDNDAAEKIEHNLKKGENDK